MHITLGEFAERLYGPTYAWIVTEMNDASVLYHVFTSDCKVVHHCHWCERPLHEPHDLETSRDAYKEKPPIITATLDLIAFPTINLIDRRIRDYIFDIQTSCYTSYCRNDSCYSMSTFFVEIARGGRHNNIEDML